MGASARVCLGTKRVSQVLPSGGCDVINGGGHFMLMALVGILLVYNQFIIYTLGVAQVDATRKIEILTDLGAKYGDMSDDMFLMTSHRYKDSHDGIELDDPEDTYALIRGITDDTTRKSRPRRRAKSHRHASNGGITDDTTRKSRPRRRAKSHRHASNDKSGKRLLSYLNNSKRTLHNVYDFIDEIEENVTYHPSILLVPNLVQQDKFTGIAELAQSTTTMEKGSIPDMAFFNGTLKVTRKGRYFVYAQVTYNGRKEARNITTPSCAYRVTAKAEGDADSLGLMFSATTQYRLGRLKGYDRIRGVAKGRYAHDSAYVAGVYILDRGDSVHIVFGPGAHCDVRTEPDKTFFGAYLLSKSV